MKLLGKKKKKSSFEEEEQEYVSEETLAGILDLKRSAVPEGHVEVETYPLQPPFSYATIAQNEQTGSYIYIVDELPLTREENELFFRMKNILEYELQAPEGEETLKESFNTQIPEIIESNQKIFRVKLLLKIISINKKLQIRFMLR